MASIPGAQLNITGASGSQGLLSPRNGWRVYVLPRGGYAAQDSTGTLITFDSTSVASRFAASNWIQAGLNTSNIRQVAAVGGNSLSVSGAALTITENDRIYLIGNTEPTVSGGSATYTTPATLIRQRDDDGADLYTNSMITSNADGLIQFFGSPNYYDAIVQDGNRTNQGSIIDLPLGSVGGISTDVDALFGASLTVNGALGVTGWATFGSTVTFNAAIGVTGWATFGATVTMGAALGVTGVATFSGRAAFGNSISVDGALGVTGLATLSGGVSIAGGVTISTGVLTVTNQPRCLVRLTADVNVPDGTVFGVSFGSEVFDTGAMHDTATNNGRITVPAGAGGLYLITAQGTWGNTAATAGVRRLRLHKNGTAISPVVGSAVYGSSIASGFVIHGFSIIDSASAGDYYELEAFVTGDTISLQGGATDGTLFGAAKIA